MKLLAYRYELAERVYFHHAKNAASVMIGRAVQEAGWAAGTATPDHLDANFHWLSDEMLLRALVEPAVEAALDLKSADVADRVLAAQSARRVLDRDLFKIVYLAVHDDVADGAARICEQYGESPCGRKALEDRLASAAGVPPGAVLVHVPRKKMMTKDADVRVRTSGREIIKLHEWDKRHSRRVEALNQAHERLWRVTVYIDPRHLEAVEIVRAAAADEFRAASRYVERDPGSAYVDEVFRRLSLEWDVNLHDREALLTVPLKRDDDMSLEATKAAVLEQIKLFREEHDQPALEAARGLTTRFPRRSARAATIAGVTPSRCAAWSTSTMSPRAVAGTRSASANASSEAFLDPGAGECHAASLDEYVRHLVSEHDPPTRFVQPIVDHDPRVARGGAEDTVGHRSRLDADAEG